ncbi:Vacuolar protein sorting-associated protein [Quillaja saponaria]|uniref:Vacuolar protein sorting-associated protein n=1 Tax=Quillaja saponaria TaxID=32244 RepID=A0AAD7L838_QUISA|nr:Vacuolar protein sorting-associated protein [Quillaja saponaria]
MACMTSINSKEQRTLWLRGGFSQREEFNLFENVIRKHKSSSDDSLLYVQFRTDESELGWSGPVCIASLGRFFLKFRKATNQATVQDRNTIEFAAVHVVEEGSTLVLRFYKPPNISLPYRIENCLRNLSITYYQKGSLEPEVLGSACSVGYVWDDLTLPHRLVVRINDGLLLQEIKLDKVRPWKPLYKHRQHSLLAPHLLLDKKSIDWKPSFSESDGREMLKVGYEIYADGPTRVLRICEISQSFKGDTVFHSYGKIQLRISQFAVHLLEHANQDGDENEKADYTPIMIAKLENMSLDTVLDDRQKYNQFTIQSLNLELKWVGAPFAAMLRRHQLDYNSSDECVLKVVFVLLTTSSNVKQVKYSSIFLQPIDLNLDEETMMRIIPFWRSSLSDSQSQQFYFDHFEIHPIKIIANFIPGESHSSYSTAQETIRSFLHSVIKVPPMKNMVVELNGVLVTHALITMRELFVKCAQHYSWYAVRAIYIAKGSPLLPPDFVSIFDDLASSSLDVFFDPSRGLMNLPGFTLGTFKLISKCIKGEGFSGTKRYFGDLGKTLRTAGSNVLFAAVTEISDSVLKGAETSGFNGMVTGFHQGILKLAMEPALLGTALMEGGPDRKIKLDQSPGVDELYIEGYLQAMLDTIYRQEYLRVRVIDNQVFLKNLPPNNSLIDEIMDRVKEFLVSKALLKGDPSTSSRPLRHLRGETEWRIGPTVLTLCEHLFVSFAIRMLRKNSNKFMPSMNWNKGLKDENHVVDSANASPKEQKVKFMWKWGIGKFVLSGVLAYIDGRLCRCIPNPIARRIVSGFLLSFLDKTDNE